MSIFLRRQISLGFILVIGASLFGCKSTQSVGFNSNGWVLRYREDFELLKLPREPEWNVDDSSSEKSPYADDGAFFHKTIKNFTKPEGFRISQRFGTDSWLTLESYTRDRKQPLLALAEVQPDPENSKNNVLRIESFFHTNGTLVRPTKPLPPEYRICVRGGYIGFGTGYLHPGHNGYRGDERAEPWVEESSLSENGIYWLSILSDIPRPRNNIWIHHHRKVVIDSDNNAASAAQGGPWTWIWNGKDFVQSGEHPVMMFALDRNHKNDVANYDLTGQPFISLANDRWNVEAETHQIRAVDAYREHQWYDTCIEKTETEFTLSITGDFVYGGKRAYKSSIPRSWVFDPAGSPDYFMFGDPHINFYRGISYFDDIRLYVRSARSQ